MLWLIALSTMMLLGLWLLIAGLRGRRIDTHAICRRCGYDLHGLDGPTKCPECGGDLARRRAMRIGNRRRRPVVAWLGVAVLALAARGLWTPAAEVVSGIVWRTYEPVWMLQWEIDLGGSSASLGAVDELFRRYTAGQLAAEQVEQMVAYGVAAQLDVSRPWDPRWGELIEREFVAGRMSREAWQQYMLRMVEGRFSLELHKPRGSWGSWGPREPLEANLRVAPARPRLTTHRFRRANERYALDGVPFDVYKNPEGGGPTRGIYDYSWYSFELPASKWYDLTPGKHTVRYTFDLMVGDMAVTTSSVVPVSRVVRPTPVQRVTVEATFEVPPEAEDVAREQRDRRFAPDDFAPFPRVR